MRPSQLVFADEVGQDGGSDEATVPRPVLPHRQPHRVLVQLVQGLLAAARVVAERRPAACEDRFLLAELRVERCGCGGYVQEVWIWKCLDD